MLFWLRSYFSLGIICLYIIWPGVVFGKYQVCSITINSADEIDIFRQYLSPRDFDFVELVPFEQALPNNTHWFLDACQKNYRCDIVVVSGHFGGLFFGKKHNYILPVDMMERQSCSNTCNGVLSRAKEVFLFGCNTLADKGRDHRTPEEYARMLVEEYHMIIDMAQMVSATKYLPFGLSFEEQMRIVFSNPRTTIYGFNSLSPVGSKIRQSLSNYFEGINQRYGNYRSYLDQKQPGVHNSILHRTIGGSIKEVRGLSLGSDIFNNAQKICPLYVSTLSDLEGVQTIEQLFKDGDGLMAYTAIKQFISQHYPFEGDSLYIFDQIKGNVQLRDEFIRVYNQISDRLPYIKIQFLNFLYTFDWVDEGKYQTALRYYTLGVVEQSTSSAHDFISALVYDEKISFQRLNLNANDFPDLFYRNLWSAKILEVLNIQDYRIHRQLMNLCVSKLWQKPQDPVVCYQVMKSLGHLNVADSIVIDKMLEFLKLDPPDYGLAWYAMYGLAYAHIQDTEIHRAIARHIYYAGMNDSETRWVQLQAINTLAFLKVQDSKIGEWLVYVLQESDSDEILLATFEALYQMQQPPFKWIKAVINERKLLQHSNKEIRKIAGCFVGRCGK